MVVLVGRWSKKAITWWQWESLDSAHSHCSGLQGDSVQSIWQFYWQDGLEKAIHQWHWVSAAHSFWCSGRQLWVSDSFREKKVLKRPFFIELAKPSHVCSGPVGDRALNQYDSFSGKMVLKRPFLSDIGEALTQLIHCSGLPGDSFELIH